MKWKDSGSFYFQKDSEGRWHLVIPGNFEFENDKEREAKERALKNRIEDVLKLLLGGDSN